RPHRRSRGVTSTPKGALDEDTLRCVGGAGSPDVNLLLLEADQLRGPRAVLSAIQARHARDVLRVVPGQDLRVGMLDGPRGVGRVVRIAAALDLACRFAPDTPPET